jgi:transporter family-2 protein
LNTTTAAALAVALGTGIALGVQATTNGHIGTQIGPASTGLLVIVAGGILSAVVFGVFRNRLFAADLGALRGVAAGIVLAGVLAVVAIAGTAYALPEVGVAAGLAAIILGQMLVAVVVDSAGWGGMERVALSAPRVLGLILLAAAVWLLTSGR